MSPAATAPSSTRTTAAPLSRDECEGDVGSAEGVYNVEGIGSGDGVTGADDACVYCTVV